MTKRVNPVISAAAYPAAGFAAMEVATKLGGKDVDEAFHQWLGQVFPAPYLTFLVVWALRWIVVDAEHREQRNEFDAIRRGAKRYKKAPKKGAVPGDGSENRGPR